MSYRLRVPLELERLQDRLIGTGSADTTPHEFSNNVQRDTKTSVIGHPSHLMLVSIGMGINSEKARVALLERMIMPNKIEDAEVGNITVLNRGALR
ncbi:hypothetical protein BS50DRAFT_496464 [Corynespora cassiicola Philippines]|uniref:Splicing factor 3B subunit 5/RDS3 complex subunit 10 n=1 Tax=Corynespora cassiicola Philippines TaxID=1448308 RepID=A0A2T2NJA8_CORCC|nr:hypothetical protein BS50DRAFT_496464 [Corynespora cassiicola Philippines]